MVFHWPGIPAIVRANIAVESTTLRLPGYESGKLKLVL